MVLHLIVVVASAATKEPGPTQGDPDHARQQQAHEAGAEDSPGAVPGAVRWRVQTIIRVVLVAVVIVAWLSSPTSQLLCLAMRPGRDWRPPRAGRRGICTHGAQ
jgi:hypothetical protein